MGNTQWENNDLISTRNSNDFMSKISRLVSCLLIVILTGAGANAQVNTVEFGKNRVQYQKFIWKYYQIENCTLIAARMGLAW